MRQLLVCTALTLLPALAAQAKNTVTVTKLGFADNFKDEERAMGGILVQFLETKLEENYELVSREKLRGLLNAKKTTIEALAKCDKTALSAVRRGGPRFIMFGEMKKIDKGGLQLTLKVLDTKAGAVGTEATVKEGSIGGLINLLDDLVAKMEPFEVKDAKGTLKPTGSGKIVVNSPKAAKLLRTAQNYYRTGLIHFRNTAPGKPNRSAENNKAVLYFSKADALCKQITKLEPGNKAIADFAEEVSGYKARCLKMSKVRGIR